MATPIGHVLGGYLVYTCGSAARPVFNRIAIWVCLVLVVSPDLDFLPGLLVGQSALYHQGISHSLEMALIVGLVGALVVAMGTSLDCRMRDVWLPSSYVSHLFIDLFGPDRREP